MAIGQDDISNILSILSHPLRREILLYLSEKGEASFTELLNLLKIDTGKLSFHLRSLEIFIEQTPTGKHKLSRAGERAVKVINDVESWAEVADVQGKASQLPLASVKQRCLAFVIDFALISAITAIILLPQIFSVSARETFLTAGMSTGIFITVGLLWVYSTLLEGFSGQTLGKRTVGLKAVRTDGKKMFYDCAAIRNFGKLLPLLPFDLIVGWRLKNVIFRRYFDKFAGTTVIDLRTTCAVETPPLKTPLAAPYLDAIVSAIENTKPGKIVFPYCKKIDQEGN